MGWGLLQAVEEGGAGISKTLALSKKMPFGHSAQQASRPEPPSLHQVLTRTAPQAESSGEIARITEDEEVQGDAAFQNRPSGSPNRSPQNAFGSLSGRAGPSPPPTRAKALNSGPLPGRICTKCLVSKCRACSLKHCAMT